jgi:lipid II:glycine glycyltransferase (peptidoglycan interpeptide bridge formation enzyme)
MIKIKVDNKPDEKWNERLKNSDLSTIYQTKENAILNEQIGRKPLFIKFLDPSGNIVGQLVGFKSDRFKNIKKSISFLGKFTKMKICIFDWLYGPIIFNNDFESEIYSLLENFLLDQKCVVSGTTHPLSKSEFANFTKPFDISQWGTFLIDLSIEKNSLWENLEKHSAKKNIERALKKGVIVKEITKNELPYYQQIRQETKPVSLNVLEQRWDFLHDIGWTGFLAFYNDKPVGGIMISYFNGFVNEWGIARTEEDTSRKLYAQDLLKWNIIKWGNKKKYSFYDLTGVNPNPINDKEKGIFRYKQKWGGSLFNFNKIILN